MIDIDHCNEWRGKKSKAGQNVDIFEQKRHYGVWRVQRKHSLLFQPFPKVDQLDVLYFTFVAPVRLMAEDLFKQLKWRVKISWILLLSNLGQLTFISQ